MEIFLEDSERSTSIRKILFAPTWEGFVSEADYTSVSNFGIALLESILLNKDVDVVFKPHPFTGSRKPSAKVALKQIEAMEKEYPNLTVLGHEHKIYPQMNWCDLMIADIGSVVNDFLATGKPAIVTSVQGVPLTELHTRFPTTNGTYAIDDPANINELVHVISLNDPMADIRNEVRKASLGDFKTSSLEQFENVVRAGIRS